MRFSGPPQKSLYWTNRFFRAYIYKKRQRKCRKPRCRDKSKRKSRYCQFQKDSHVVGKERLQIKTFWNRYFKIGRCPRRILLPRSIVQNDNKPQQKSHLERCLKCQVQQSQDQHYIYYFSLFSAALLHVVGFLLSFFHLF